MSGMLWKRVIEAAIRAVVDVLLQEKRTSKPKKTGTGFRRVSKPESKPTRALPSQHAVTGYTRVHPSGKTVTVKPYQRGNN